MYAFPILLDVELVGDGDMGKFRSGAVVRQIMCFVSMFAKFGGDANHVVNVYVFCILHVAKVVGQCMVAN